jgi:hypothetical protein
VCILKGKVLVRAEGRVKVHLDGPEVVGSPITWVDVQDLSSPGEATAAAELTPLQCLADAVVAAKGGAAYLNAGGELVDASEISYLDNDYVRAHRAKNSSSSGSGSIGPYGGPASSQFSSHAKARCTDLWPLQVAVARATVGNSIKDASAKPPGIGEEKQEGMSSSLAPLPVGAKAAAQAALVSLRTARLRSALRAAECALAADTKAAQSILTSTSSPSSSEGLGKAASSNPDNVETGGIAAPAAVAPAVVAPVADTSESASNHTDDKADDGSENDDADYLDDWHGFPRALRFVAEGLGSAQGLYALNPSLRLHGMPVWSQLRFGSDSCSESATENVTEDGALSGSLRSEDEMDEKFMIYSNQEGAWVLATTAEFDRLYLDAQKKAHSSVEREDANKTESSVDSAKIWCTQQHRGRHGPHELQWGNTAGVGSAAAAAGNTSASGTTLGRLFGSPPVLGSDSSSFSSSTSSGFRPDSSRNHEFGRPFSTSPPLPYPVPRGASCACKHCGLNGSEATVVALGRHHQPGCPRHTNAALPPSRPELEPNPFTSSSVFVGYSGSSDDAARVAIPSWAPLLGQACTRAGAAFSQPAFAARGASGSSSTSNGVVPLPPLASALEALISELHGISALDSLEGDSSTTNAPSTAEDSDEWAHLRAVESEEAEVRAQALTLLPKLASAALRACVEVELRSDYLLPQKSQHYGQSGAGHFGDGSQESASTNHAFSQKACEVAIIDGLVDSLDLEHALKQIQRLAEARQLRDLSTGSRELASLLSMASELSAAAKAAITAAAAQSNEGNQDNDDDDDDGIFGTSDMDGLGGHSRGGHTGEFRDHSTPGAFRLCCSLESQPEGLFVCRHQGGIISHSHWSCCGALSIDDACAGEGSSPPPSTESVPGGPGSYASSQSSTNCTQASSIHASLVARLVHNPQLLPALMVLPASDKLAPVADSKDSGTAAVASRVTVVATTAVAAASNVVTKLGISWYPLRRIPSGRYSGGVRVRRKPSLSSPQCGHLAWGVFPSDSVPVLREENGWLKLAPVAYATLQRSNGFEAHDSATEGWCKMEYEGEQLFEEPSAMPPMGVELPLRFFLPANDVDNENSKSKCIGEGMGQNNTTSGAVAIDDSVRHVFYQELLPLMLDEVTPCDTFKLDATPKSQESASKIFAGALLHDDESKEEKGAAESKDDSRGSLPAQVSSSLTHPSILTIASALRELRWCFSPSPSGKSRNTNRDGTHQAKDSGSSSTSTEVAAAAAAADAAAASRAREASEVAKSLRGLAHVVSLLLARGPAAAAALHRPPSPPLRPPPTQGDSSSGVGAAEDPLSPCERALPLTCLLTHAAQGLAGPKWSFEQSPLGAHQGGAAKLFFAYQEASRGLVAALARPSTAGKKKARTGSMSACSALNEVLRDGTAHRSLLLMQALLEAATSSGPITAPNNLHAPLLSTNGDVTSPPPPSSSPSLNAPQSSAVLDSRAQPRESSSSIQAKGSPSVAAPATAPVGAPFEPPADEKAEATFLFDAKAPQPSTFTFSFGSDGADSDKKDKPSGDGRFCFGGGKPDALNFVALSTIKKKQMSDEEIQTKVNDVILGAEHWPLEVRLPYLSNLS